ERLSNSPSGVAQYWADLVVRDTRAALPTVRVPTLVLHRRDDPYVRVEHGRYLAANVEGAIYVELDGADDMFFVGDTKILLDEIELFLTGSRQTHDVDRVL